MGLRVARLIVCAVALAATASAAELSVILTDHSVWNGLLHEFVNEQSRFDYKRLQEQAMPRLEAYLAEIARSGSGSVDAAEKKAFLINAYNALTVSWIVRNYPAASIWSTPDPFKNRRHTLGGKRVSLDEIESMLREMEDPRIHAALVCAARSCPPLRREAYVAERIEEQLDDNTRLWLADPRLNQFDAATAEARVSSIFKWYHDDFKNGGVEAFLKHYAPEDFRRVVGHRKLKITYLEYDWGLNDPSDLGKDYSWFRMAVDWVRNVFR